MYDFIENSKPEKVILIRTRGEFQHQQDVFFFTINEMLPHFILTQSSILGKLRIVKAEFEQDPSKFLRSQTLTSMAR